MDELKTSIYFLLNDSYMELNEQNSNDTYQKESRTHTVLFKKNLT